MKSKLCLKRQATKVPCSFNKKGKFSQVKNCRWGFTWGLMGPFPSLGTVVGCLCCSAASSGCIQHPSTKLLSLRKMDKCPFELERIQSLRTALLCFLYLMLKITVITFKFHFRAFSGYSCVYHVPYGWVKQKKLG